MAGIIGWNDLDRRLRATNDMQDRVKRGGVKYNKGLVVALLNAREVELTSHMALQERNEKLRIQNARLIAIIAHIKKVLKLT